MRYLVLAAIAAGILLAVVREPPAQAEPRLIAPECAPPIPEFTHRTADAWINSAPLAVDNLRGQVVVLDFWTFGCWNCYKSFPWLKAVATRYAPRGLKVVGVHTPEFDHEKGRDRVVEKVREFGLDHPVMMDNDGSYWRALRNRYWPAFFLIDRDGRVRSVFTGETHEGDEQARAIEASIQALLDEPI